MEANLGSSLLSVQGTLQFRLKENFMKQLYVRGRDVDPVVPDMKACTDTSKPEQSPLGRRPLDPKDGALLTAAAMASRRDFGCGAV